MAAKEEERQLAVAQPVVNVTPETQPKTRESRNIEVVVAITLGALALVCFAAQVRTTGTHSTATEVFLFNSLQFILTAGFAWFSTRAVSRIEFERSLKRFAISAYRRVADIERMIDRLHFEVRDMISDAPKSEATNLRIVDAIVSDTGQLVRSSISDWGDVIGEELLAIERIKRLERERERLPKDDVSAKASPELEGALKRIDGAIARIQRTLPPRLQLETGSGMREERAAERAAQWLESQHRRQRGLRLTVVTGDRYLSERDRKTLKPGEILVTDRNNDQAIDVRDKEGRGVGRLQNTTPMPYDGFVRAMDRCYGETPLSLEFVELHGEEVRKGELYAWLRVKVATEPLGPPAFRPDDDPSAPTIRS